MTIVRGRTITEQELQIDDKIFVGCTLIRCNLGYGGGPVAFESTLLRNCKYTFFGQARATVQFLQEVGLMPYIQEEWGEFPSVQDGDGESDGHSRQ